MKNSALVVPADTTKENKNRKTGIYVYALKKETLNGVLLTAKYLGVRTEDPVYFWARLCQSLANHITSESLNYRKEPDYSTGIGIGIVSDLLKDIPLETVFYVNDKFEVVRETDGKELKG